ncbi:TRAP transporter small permease [Alkalibacillus salilacus]|uniref:TRAP-type C4-dicarboxylate transport system permease small subunit n=1 Tax=Alkalibacillus salilacus TaxID=284582 RepID=A0ABT9VHM0_9BACI|nr:TRAP transporter small permease subunit [Alkalibacillus salilacus]MDQ0160463.1 TRAP-type C4-dicarboxylate transport system permease small subunit [Alkalibacillus salilacus]
MDKAVKFVERIQIALGLFFLTVFFVVILFQIATRHLGISIIWTEEVATYSFIWSVLMGAAIMVNRREHFNFDVIQKKLKGKMKLGLNLFNDAVLIVFNIALLSYGIDVVNQFWDYTWTSLPDMKMGYIWIAVPIMAATMILYSTNHLIRHVKEFLGKGVQS